MDSTRLFELAHAAIVAPRVAPAASVAFAIRDGDIWTVRTGAAGTLLPARATPVLAASPFDLASVTKPLVAATAARLVERSVLEFGTSIGSLVKEAAGTPSAAASLESLLAHRAGLKPHLPLYAPIEARRALDRRQALRAAASGRTETSGDARSSSPAVYSDLGYILAGEALARKTAIPLDALVAQEVATPLGLEVGSARQWLSYSGAFMHHVVPTEFVRWRGGLVRGTVHDENAWALAGHGLCGHAGLFGTAEGVARFGAAVLDALDGRASWLSRHTVERLLRHREGGPLRAGFDGKSSEGSSAGTLCSSLSFGHLGFTGTSFWCDPEARIVTVLLTNRVCPSREHRAIREARPHVHDALFEMAQAGG